VSELLKHRYLRPVLMAGVPAAVLIGVFLFWQWGGRYIATENAYIKADIAPRVLGALLAVVSALLVSWR
jgi:multidrug resistance efflux pump